MVHVSQDGHDGLANGGHRRRTKNPTLLEGWPLRWSTHLLPQPGLVDPGVRVNLVGFEEQRDLAFRALRRVGPVDHIATDCEREIPANRPRFGFCGISLPHHLADGGDRSVSLEDDRDDRPGGDVTHERFEEGLPFVLRIVRLPQGATHADEFQRRHLQTATLESGDDFPNEAALHRVRLQEDEGAFGHGQALFFAFLAVGAGASSSSAGSRLRPLTSCHRPSSQDLNVRRPSGESFHARNSALSIRVTGLAPCFFFDQPTIDVRNELLATKSEYCRSRSPRERSGPSRLSIRSERSDGMSFPFGVSMATSTARASGAGASATATASSAA